MKSPKKRISQKKQSRSFFGKERTNNFFFQKKGKPQKEEEEKEEVQAKSEPGTGSAGTTTVSSSLSNTKGGGDALPASAKSQMESGFGTSFSDVKIHTDSEAVSMSEEINAQAFTYGSDIFFNKGMFNPGTAEGDALLAHELVHTLQQKGATKTGTHFDQEAEEEADSGALSVLKNIQMKKIGPQDLKNTKKTKAGKKLGVQRCSKKDTPAPAPMVDEVIKEPEKRDAGRTINVRGEVNPVLFKQNLAQIDILGEGGGLIDKKIEGKKTQVYDIRAYAISYTEPDIAQSFNNIFPAGSETTIEKNSDPKMTALQGLIMEYRKKHPNSFSKLQGRNLLIAKSAKPDECIDTLNEGMEGLYGNKRIDKGGLGDKVTDTMSALKEKGFTEPPMAVSATYPATVKLPEVTDVTLNGSIGGMMADRIKSKEDGIYVFLLSVSNGYHSIAITLYKKGPAIEILWKDQHWGDPKYDRLIPKTPADIDSKIKEYLVGSAKTWVAKEYNKHNDPDVQQMTEITDEAKKQAAIKSADPSIRADFTKNTFMLLRPEAKKAP